MKGNSDIHQAVKKKGILSSPIRAISMSFALVIAVGTLLLMTPMASRQGVWTPFIDALFTATSATCVTGLVVYDTYTYWTVFGQCVILALIQIGGLGLVTFAAFFGLLIGKKLGLRDMQMVQESIGFGSVASIGNTLRTVVICVLAIEATGALLLCTVFVPRYGLEGIYISIFLAISAFCNAGFDILGRESPFISLSNYNGEPMVILVICALIIVGGLGFVVWVDVAQYHRTHTLTLQSRVVLFMTALLVVFGAVMFGIYEWNNPATMQPLEVQEKVMASLMQSVTTRTAGFNSIDVANMKPVSKGFSIFLMFIGASPGSTGGGVKTTTPAVLLMTIYCVMRGRGEIILWGRRVDAQVVYRTVTLICLGVALIFTASLAIDSMLDPQGVHMLDVLFEATSAFSTTGLSSGVTSAANTASKYILVILMYLGRVGPISFALSLGQTVQKRREIVPEGRIVVG